jgi:hypothetical protein
MPSRGLFLILRASREESGAFPFSAIPRRISPIPRDGPLPWASRGDNEERSNRNVELRRLHSSFPRARFPRRSRRRLRFVIARIGNLHAPRCSAFDAGRFRPISFIAVPFRPFLRHRIRKRMLRKFTSSYDTLRRSFRINCAIYRFILSTGPLSRYSR